MTVAYLRAVLPDHQVWVTPTYQHAFGKHLTAFEHRLHMAQLAFATTDPYVVVSDLEATLGGESRTIRLVDALDARYPELPLTLVVGSDILPELPRWLEVERLLARVNLFVLRRAGFPCDDPRTRGPAFPQLSSSEIRQRIATAGTEPCRDLIPRAVLNHIEAHRLYGSTSS